MGFQLSPGINITEIDLTTIIPAVSTTIGAVAGPFRWGPVNQRMLIDSELTLIDQYGRPDNSTAEAWFTAANFLAYTNALQVVRVVGSAAKNAVVESGGAVLITNEDMYLNQYSGGQGNLLANPTGMFAAKYPGDLGNSIKVEVADIHSYDTWEYKDYFDLAPGTSDFAALKNAANDELHVIVIDEDGLWTGTKGTVLERFGFLSKATDAKSADGSSIYYPEVVNRKSKYIWWMGHPADVDAVTTNNWGQLASLGGVAVNFETLALLTTVASAVGDFTVGETVECVAKATVTSGQGFHGTAVVVGGDLTNITLTGGINSGGTHYKGVPTISIPGFSGTLTPSAPNGVITSIEIGGTLTGAVNGAIATATPIGSGATASVTVGPTGVVVGLGVTAPGSGYTAGADVIITGPGQNATATVVTSVPGAVTGFTMVTGGTGYSAITGTVVSWDTGTDKLKISPTLGTFVANLPIEGVTSHATALMGATILGGGLSMPFQEGVDDNTHVTLGEMMLGYDMFKSAEDVDISLLMGGNAADVGSTPQALPIYLIQDVTEYRRDCVVFISPPKATVVDNYGTEANDVVAFRNLLPSSSYAVMDSGWKYQYDKYADLYRWIPLNGDIAGLCARTDDERDPWWSPAGYNRGIIKNCVRLAWSPRKAYRDQLYKNGVNPVMTEVGQGHLLFGDKTMQSKPSAFDRINVRRLFIVLEKAIAVAAKYTLFEFNDAFTRAQFRNMVEPYLREVQGRRGIYDYRVVCDETNNTPQVIDSNQFVGDIYVKPARSINFIQLNFIAVRTGVDFNEIVGKF